MLRPLGSSKMTSGVLPDAVDPWVSFVAIVVITCTTSSVQYALMPMTNPYDDPNYKAWWQCLAGCVAIWFPLCFLYLWHMTNQFVLGDVDEKLSFKDVFLLLLLGNAACVITRVSQHLWLFLDVAPWIYPFPLGGIITASAGFVSIAIGMGCMIYKKLKGRSDLKTYMFKAFIVQIMFVWSFVVEISVFMFLASQARARWHPPLLVHGLYPGRKVHRQTRL